MNGIHDMGGLHGFGPVPIEANEPVFHSIWESRVFCMTQVIDTLGIWNLDEHRHEIEKMPAQDYLNHGYYGRWLFAMEHILERRGILDRAEIDRRAEDLRAGVEPPRPASRPDRHWPLAEAEKVRWGAWRHEITVTPRFAVDDVVRVRNLHPPGHTRVTNYTRGKMGVVTRVNAEAWVFPDTRAHYRGECLQAVYNVRFPAQELWGEAHAEPNLFVHIDLSEDHLEPVEVDHA